MVFDAQVLSTGTHDSFQCGYGGAGLSRLVPHKHWLRRSDPSGKLALGQARFLSALPDQLIHTTHIRYHAPGELCLRNETTLKPSVHHGCQEGDWVRVSEAFVGGLLEIPRTVPTAGPAAAGEPSAARQSNCQIRSSS